MVAEFNQEGDVQFLGALITFAMITTPWNVSSWFHDKKMEWETI